MKIVTLGLQCQFAPRHTRVSKLPQGKPGGGRARLVENRALASVQAGPFQIQTTRRPFVGYGNRSTLLVVVSREIKQMARKRGLNVVDVNPKTAKKSVTGSGSATKRDVARVLCSQYPELRIYLGQTHKYKDKYWQNMFDAVAVGLCASATD